MPDAPVKGVKNAQAIMLTIPSEPGSQPKTLFCNQPGVNIPDNNQNGVSNSISINDHRYIGDIDIRLDIDHTWVGDLQIQLTHAESGGSVLLMDRPGFAGGNDTGCKLDNISRGEYSCPVRKNPS